MLGMRAMISVRTWAVVLVGLAFLVPASGQTFSLVGDAVALGGDCYRMTAAQNTQNGGVWCEQALDLTEPFDLAFQLHFGGNDGGADGMVFVLQTVGLEAAGTGGGGIGYLDITPSFGIEFDTWQNPQFADPWYDHIGFISNGSTSHDPPTGLGGPVQANATNPNIEDGVEHPVRILWEPLTMTMSVLFDCEVRLSATVDLIGSVFGGTTSVTWGFVASTGGANNEQRFCLDSADELGTSVDVTVCEGQSTQLAVPGLPAGSVGCAWTPATGLDNPFSATPNCTVSASTTYVVTYPLCQDTGSDTVHVEVEGPPEADFMLFETSSCASPVEIEALLSVGQASGVAYNWTLNGASVGSGVSPSGAVATGPGTWVVGLEAVSAAGCIGTEAQDFDVFPAVEAAVDWWPVAGCAPLAVTFEDASVNAAQVLLQAGPAGGATVIDEVIGGDGLAVELGAPGTWSVWVQAVSPEGCVDTVGVGDALEVWPLPEAQFTGSPLYGSPDDPDGLNDFWIFENTSSGAVSGYWDFGDGSTSESWQTSHTFAAGGVFPVTLTVLSDMGCSASATDFIAITPNLFVYIPSSFTPDNDGHNDGWGPEISDLSLIRTYSLVVVDRWGEVVWRTEDPSARWVGEAEAGGSYFVGDGTYNYVLQIMTTIGGDKTREWSGAVSVLR